MKLAMRARIIGPVIVFLTACLLVSCNSGGDLKSGGGLTVRIDDKSAELMTPSDYYELQRLMPLDCPDGLFIGHIARIMEMNDGGYLMFDDGNNEMYLFDRDGVFKTKVGTKGRAEKEYLFWNDCRYCPTTDRIYALDRYKQSVFEFDSKGECISVTGTPFMANSFVPAQDAFWLYTCFPDANKRKFQLTKVDDSLQKSTSAWFPLADFVGNTFHSCFSTDNNGNSYFFYPNDNVIYRLSDVPKPFLKVDFGDRTLPYEEIRKYGSSEYDSMRNSYSYLGFIEDFYVADSLCRFLISESKMNQPGKTYQVFVNMNSGDCSLFKGIMNSGDSIGVDFQNLLGISKSGEWLFSVDPSSIPPFLFNNLNKCCPSVTSDDNPVIAFYKIIRSAA